MNPEEPRGASPTGLLNRQDFLGGLVIIGVSAFAYWLGHELPIGTLGGMGPGMLPKGLALLLGMLGVLLLVTSLSAVGEPVRIATLRGPLFVFGSLIAFGLTVRPLGLAVAGPIAIVISAFASDEVRWVEAIVSGLLTTAFCVALFKFALALPIPLAPWLLGY